MTSPMGITPHGGPCRLQPIVTYVMKGDEPRQAENPAAVALRCRASQSDGVLILDDGLYGRQLTAAQIKTRALVDFSGTVRNFLYGAEAMAILQLCPPSSINAQELKQEPDSCVQPRAVALSIHGKCDCSEEGVTFKPGVAIGSDIAANELVEQFDAVVLAGGSETPRDLPAPGRDLSGVHFAMEFLPQQNKVVAGDKLAEQLSASGKRVLVIGGGDTGSDCVGTSNRQGALSVTQIELLPQPPAEENREMSWPYWPLKLRTSSSHEEGCERDWSITTKAFVAGTGRDAGRLQAVRMARVEWQRDAKTGVSKMVEIPGSEFDIQADLVLLAMGFTGPTLSQLIEPLALVRDGRGNVRAATDGKDAYATSQPKVFAAGDMRRGEGSDSKAGCAQQRLATRQYDLVNGHDVCSP